MISQGLIESLKKLSRETTADAEAREGAEHLVGLFGLLIKIDPTRKTEGFRVKYYTVKPINKN